MSRFTVNLAGLRERSPCYNGYNRLVRSLQGKPFTVEDSEFLSYIAFAHKSPIDIAYVLDSNGFDDALWATRACAGVDRDLRLFAVWCARAKRNLMREEPLRALDIAEDFANGLCDDEARAEAALWSAAAWRSAARAAMESERSAAAVVGSRSMYEARFRQMLADDGWIGSTHHEETK